MSIFNHKSYTLGADLSAINNSLTRFGVLARRVFDYAILDIHDISRTIGILQNRGKRFTSLYAHISGRKSYIFDNKEKSPITAAAIVYDFVDGFVVSDFGTDFDKTIDPLLNLRLINDEYREIFLSVPAHYSEEEMDRLLEYVNYSDLDGLLLNNGKQFAYFTEKGSGSLKLYVNNLKAPKEYDSYILKGAKAAFIKAKGKLAGVYVLEGLRFRMKSKLTRSR